MSHSSHPSWSYYFYAWLISGVKVGISLYGKNRKWKLSEESNNAVYDNPKQKCRVAASGRNCITQHQALKDFSATCQLSLNKNNKVSTTTWQEVLKIMHSTPTLPIPFQLAQIPRKSSSWGTSKWSLGMFIFNSSPNGEFVHRLCLSNYPINKNDIRTC